MKYKSLIFSQASGSIGGMTFSHNLGGLYTRARSIPTNPGTDLQAAVRAVFGGLVASWQQNLTPEQRAAWRTYAANVPLVGPLGDPIHVTGMNMYIRGNAPRINAGLDSIDDAPTEFNLGFFTNPVLTVSEASQEVNVEFSDDDEWTGQTGAAMLVQASRPKSPAIVFYKGPYVYAGKIPGDTAIPITSPVALPLPFEVVEGQQVFFQVCVVGADCRRSLNFRFGAEVAS